MPPVKTVASSSDVDTEATAELPVLDVAAYESTLGDPISNTDTWAAPAPAALTTAVPELDAAGLNVRDGDRKGEVGDRLLRLVIEQRATDRR